MVILSQNKHDFLNEKHVRIKNIRKAFPGHVERCRYWAISGCDKIPLQPDGKPASINDPHSMQFFDWIKPVLLQSQELFPAIAVQGQLLCIDLDNCIDDSGNLSSLAKECLASINSYAEISRSGRGIHIFFLGKKPGTSCRTEGLEFYGGTNAHFMTVTGDTLKGREYKLQFVSQDVIDAFYFKHFPEKKEEIKRDVHLKSPPLSSSEILALLNQASNKNKFQKLFYNGDISDYKGDASSADFALVCLIGFYSQEPEKVFEIFQGSALYKNPERQAKWARDDYRKATLEKALASITSTYQPSQKERIALTISGVKGTWENPTWPDNDIDPVDEPFPLHCLPVEMRNAVDEIARDVRVDPGMVAVSALGITSLVAGTKVLVVEKEGLEHFPSLFLLCIAAPVERKSESYRRILDPLRDLLENDIKQWESEKCLAICFNETIDDQVTSVKAEMKKSVRAGQEKIDIQALSEKKASLLQQKKIIPPHPKNWADDVTPEKLKRNLFAYQGNFGLFSSEGRTILHTIRNEDGQNATAKSLYTAGVWGDPLDRDRVSGGEKGEGERWELRKPALVVLCFVQPDVWEEFSKDPVMRSSGLISRICVARPRSLVGTRIENPQTEPYNKNRVLPFIHLLDKIRRWTPIKSPIVVPLSLLAAEERRSFHNAWEMELGAEGRYADVGDVVGRCASIATRLALLFTLLRAAGSHQLGAYSLEVSLDDWMNAEEIQEWFMSHSIDSIRSQNQSSEDCERKVFRWIAKHFKDDCSEFLVATLRNRCRLTKEEVDRVIPLLVERGVIRPGKKARNNSQYYEVNPKIEETAKEETDE